MESTLKRTWAEIDLDALAHNYGRLRQHIGPKVRFLGVVKADAYGHGAVQVARTLQELGADYLAVSSIDEAMELRANGVTMPVLILGHTPKEQVGRLIEHHITQAVTCKAKALEYSREAAALGGTLKIHIKVDTGMSRLGYLCDGSHFDGGVEGICEACGLPGLEAEGIFTHFAVADEQDQESRAYARRQFDLFCRVIRAVEEKRGVRFPLRHCANTGAVVEPHPSIRITLADGSLAPQLITADKKQCATAGCHDWDDVVAATENWGGQVGVNPHRSHQGEAIDCSNCHSVHGQSIMYCNTCHSWEVPEGWSSPAK